ncbi:MAG TPA: tetratricopeptide repeat protein [Opitutaceae bacterium]|jgi:tetratricopeptide (TPR) repeat protein|nr:tetratricopeptide repeat protein [Opitutaceae bacterium]
MKRGAWMLLAVLAALWAYAPVRRAGFIWDDDAHVTRADLQGWAGLGRICTEPGATQQYYPVLHSAFWAEHRLWGDAPAPYHVLNLAWHILDALLLGFVLEGLLGSVSAAWIAAAVFALHPLAAESVAWVSEQKNTLSTAFYLGAALLYLKFDRERRARWYALGALCFAGALLSKSVTATLPLSLLVVLAWKRGRLRWADAAPLLPWGIAAAAAGTWTAWLERTQIGARGPDFALTALQRLLLSARIWWFYLGKFFWPHPLMFVYPRWPVSAHLLYPAALLAAAAAVYAAAILAASLGGGEVRRTALAALVLLLLYGIALGPVLGFVNVYPFIFSYVADHFAYLALLPLCAGIGLILARVRGGAWAAAALVLTLTAITRAQTGKYVSSETLYRTTLAQNPNAWLAHLNLGGILAGRGDAAAAVDQMRTAESLQPDYPSTHFDLGRIYLAQGRLAAAAEEFRWTLRLAPRDAEAHDNLGVVLAQLGDAAGADAQFQAALRERPRNPLAHCNRAIFLWRQGRLPEARAELNQALAEEPGLPAAEALLRQLDAAAP